LHIKKLTLKNYRSYSGKSFEFNRNLNVITGKNGSGKTNVLESIFLLSTTTSNRTGAVKDLLKKESGYFKVKAVVNDSAGDFDIEVRYEKGRGLKALINSEKVKGADLIDKMPVIMFSPEDIEVIKGAPSAMRRLINISISQVKPGYVDLLMKYRKVLKERNRLLKNQDADFSGRSRRLIGTWTQMLKKYSDELSGQRRNFTEELNEGIEKEIIKMNISDNYSLSYMHSQCSGKNIARDLRYGFTTWGAHRDEFVFLKNSRELKRFGSRGETRLAALLLRLALWRMLDENRGKKPVVLLDDVFSELDEEKRKIVGKRLDSVQGIITATEVPPEMEKVSNVINL